MFCLHLLVSFAFVSLFIHVFSFCFFNNTLHEICSCLAPKKMWQKLEKGNCDEEKHLDNLLPLLYLGFTYI